MAKLLPLKIKNKTYTPIVFDNLKNEKPFKVLFKRFPLENEVFHNADSNNIMNNDFVKNFDGSNAGKEKLISVIIDNIIQNITNQNIDYHRFAKECIESFIDLEYDSKPIHTLKDFFTLPEEAIFEILKESYIYAIEKDEFSLSDKKK